MSRITMDFLSLLLIRKEGKTPTWKDVQEHAYTSNSDSSADNVKVTSVFEPGQPFINSDFNQINFAAIDKIREDYNTELVRVLLTKLKKEKNGEIINEDAGATKLDYAFNEFISKGDSQFKSITMPHFAPKERAVSENLVGSKQVSPLISVENQD